MPGLTTIQDQLSQGTRPSILSRNIKFNASSSQPSVILQPTGKYAFAKSLTKLNDESQLSLKWKKSKSVGPGLINMGNTCYLNSILQCLTYTPPLAQYLMAHPHDCHSKSSCTLSAMEDHVKRSLGGSNEASFCPKSILSKLKWISKTLKFGRQEDSHEFMLYLLQSMQRSCAGKKKPTASGIVHDVFGGSIQSQVKCLVCKTESNTIDPVQDLCLEIKHCDSIEKALAFYTKSELLSGENRYRCQKCVFASCTHYEFRCKKLVDAQKRMTVNDLPAVLSIQLKRFDFFKLNGSKINRPVQFGETLDMGPYLSKKEVCAILILTQHFQKGMNYKLYAVLVHAGFSCNSGM